jgi:hypothetical protein
VVFSPLGYGLWLSLVERLNGVQEVPGSNPGSPIFRNLGDLLRSKKVRKECGGCEIWQLAVNSLRVALKKFWKLQSVEGQWKEEVGDYRGLIGACEAWVVGLIITL